MQYLIRERLRGLAPPGGIKSRGCLLLELARELKDLRDELEERKADRENTGSSEQQKKDSTTIIVPASEGQPKGQQRPSLISIFTGAGAQHPSQMSIQHDSRSGTGGHTPSDTLSQQTLHPPRESLSSSSTTTNKEPGMTSDTYSVDGTTPTPPTHGTNQTIISRASSIRRATRYDQQQNISGSVPHLPHSISIQHGMKIQPPKLRFVSSVEFRDSAGETSTTPLSPDSPTEDSSGENQKHRLQRSKGQSRKTFRYKRGRLNAGEGTALATAATVAAPLPQQPVAPVSASAIQQHSYFNLPPIDADNGRPLTDASWDSVSQTSSTSGYRDNNSFQTGFLSPDGSLNDGAMGIAPLGRSSSQNSLLMLFEAQDEDTLI